MVFDKQPLQLRMTAEDKKICQELGADILRRVLELNIKEYYSNQNIDIAIYEDNLQKLKEQRNKLLNDNMYYEEQIKRNNAKIKEYNSNIELINTGLRHAIDIKEQHTKELTSMLKKIKELIKQNNFNELEIQEILENRKYCTTNQIINNIIIELKKESTPADIINVVENCKK